MEAFELRLWDGRLGRWLTVDPYGEFDSPYVGMGNNPVNLIDPDGGKTSGPGDPPSKNFEQNFLQGLIAGAGNCLFSYGAKIQSAVANPMATVGAASKGLNQSIIGLWDVVRGKVNVLDVVESEFKAVNDNINQSIRNNPGNPAYGLGYGMAPYAVDAAMLFATDGAAASLKGLKGMQIIKFKGVSKKGGKLKFPGTNPAKAPKGFEWRGKPGSKRGSKDGNWHNPTTKESLRPDLDHQAPIGPHWDYKDPSGDWWRIFPDGSNVPKK